MEYYSIPEASHVPPQVRFPRPVSHQDPGTSSFPNAAAWCGSAVRFLFAAVRFFFLSCRLKRLVGSVIPKKKCYYLFSNFGLSKYTI
jgi:hypothetical protein